MPMPSNPSTKERLLFAAIGLFAQKGYAETTVREICARAGTANATAVNYYFGGKQKLYEAILDMIFAENMRRRQEMLASDDRNELAPEDKLRRFLSTMLDVGFSDSPLISDVTSIVLREMMAPSEYLDSIVERHVLPDVAEFTAILREILGQGAPDDVVRDSMVSVGGQIYYYLAFWPVFSRVYPDHPGINNCKQPLLEHLMRFSMAGLKATREALETARTPSR